MPLRSANRATGGTLPPLKSGDLNSGSSDARLLPSKPSESETNEGPIRSPKGETLYETKTLKERRRSGEKDAAIPWQGLGEESTRSEDRILRNSRSCSVLFFFRRGFSRRTRGGLNQANEKGIIIKSPVAVDNKQTVLKAPFLCELGLGSLLNPYLIKHILFLIIIFIKSKIRVRLSFLFVKCLLELTPNVMSLDLSFSPAMTPSHFVLCINRDRVHLMLTFLSIKYTKIHMQTYSSVFLILIVF